MRRVEASVTGDWQTAYLSAAQEYSPNPSDPITHLAPKQQCDSKI